LIMGRVVRQQRESTPSEDANLITDEGREYGSLSKKKRSKRKNEKEALL